jgi:hypothetical protein
MGAVLLVLAIRLMLRARMLSAVYVRSGRWRERSGVGLVLNFFVLLLQVLLVAWAASLTKVGADGITPGIVLVVLLVIGAAWLFILHLAAHGEPPRLPQRAISSSAFALAIIIILLWPEAARLWTRNGAVIVLALAESGLAFHLGAGAGLRDDPAGPWKQKIWCTAAGCVILVIAAGLLAVIH